MDFHGNSVHQVGHGHPHVVAAIKSALDTLPFSPRRFTNEYAVRLSAKLAALAPGDLNKMLFAPGGTEAIGMAIKLARIATGRHKTVSMWDSFHGASLDAISLGGEAIFRRGIGPLLPGTEHVPPCDPRAAVSAAAEAATRTAPSMSTTCSARRKTSPRSSSRRCARTDVQVPPRAYYESLRRACDRHGALLILDEIPICLGRTGRCSRSSITASSRTWWCSARAWAAASSRWRR